MSKLFAILAADLNVSERAMRWMVAGAALLVALFYASLALAHDSWISRGALKNAAGEWCCGAGDCGVMVMGTAAAVAGGYRIDAIFRIVDGERVTDEHVQEFWPYGETQLSPDGAFWRCKRPDGSPRCKFVPPPGS